MNRNFLKQNIMEENLTAELIYFIDPLLYTNAFYLNNMRTIKNRYDKGKYSIKLTSFIDNIFCGLFTNKVSSLIPLVSPKSDSITRLESAEKSLAEGNVRSPRKDGMTIQWLKYIYIKDEYEKLTKEQYRDFIELSSPLDYMGDS